MDLSIPSPVSDILMDVMLLAEKQLFDAGRQSKESENPSFLFHWAKSLSHAPTATGQSR